MTRTTQSRQTNKPLTSRLVDGGCEGLGCVAEAMEGESPRDRADVQGLCSRSPDARYGFCNFGFVIPMTFMIASQAAQRTLGKAVGGAGGVCAVAEPVDPAEREPDDQRTLRDTYVQPLKLPSVILTSASFAASVAAAVCIDQRGQGSRGIAGGVFAEGSPLKLALIANLLVVVHDRSPSRSCFRLVLCRSELSFGILNSLRLPVSQRGLAPHKITPVLGVS